MNWKIQRKMKDKSSFRLISIGFLTGIVFSGIVLILINFSINHQRINSILEATQISFAEHDQGSQVPSDGKIDINQATLKDLETLPGIGETKANAIIDFRDKYGAFEEINELSYVPGIGNTLLNSIQDLVIIN
jgi:competence protein ComEA